MIKIPDLNTLPAAMGNIEVICVDMFDGDRGVISRYNNKEEAFLIADEYNKERKSEMDTAYLVYENDILIRGERLII